MKSILFTLFLSIVFLSLHAQTSTNIATVLSTPQDTSASNYVFVVKTPGSALNRWGVAKMDSLKLKPWNLTWLNDTIVAIGDGRYVLFSGAYTNPSFVNTLSAAKVFGLSSVAISGDYNDLTNLPNLNLKYNTSNPAGYISGITAGMINGALGYIAYDGLTNNLGFLTSSSISGKQNYSDTTIWDATIPFVLGQGYLKGIDTIFLSNRIDSKLNISDTTNKWYPYRYLPEHFDTLNTNELQVLSKIGNNLTLSLGGGIYSVADEDSSITNEIQTLGGSNRTITLTSGGSYTLPQVVYDSILNKPIIPDSTLIYNSLNQKVLKSTTLTINGTAQDLSTNRTWSVGTVTSIGLSSTDLSVSGSPITTSGNITANLTTTGVSAGTYFGTLTVDTKGRITAINNPTVISVAAGARNFNQAYQVSSTKYSVVRFSNSISCNLSLSGGQSGEVYLEYSADGNTNWQLAGKSAGSNTGTLTIGLNTTQLTAGELSVLLLPGYYWRFRTNNVTGTPTYSFLGGTETVF